GIISEREIEALKKLKIVIEPGAVASNLENKLHLQQLLIKPTVSLTISYPGTAGGAEKRPSSVIRELTEIFSDLETVKYSDEETSDYRRFVRCAATKRQAMHSLSGQITRYISGEETDLKLSDALYAASTECGLDPVNELLPREADLGGRSELFFPGNKTKVSQLESYFRCPFSHFLSYGLKLKERKEGIKAVDTGNFLHKVLENYVLSIGDFTADDATAERAADEAIEAALILPEFAALNEDSMKVLKGRLVSEAKSTLGRMLEAGRHSRFQPVYVEKTFGITDEPIGFGGCSVKMSGKIDRVDAYDGYVAVVDYKTGKVESSLREVYCGKKIQLYVYLYALKKNYGYKPFGAFYYSVDNDYKRESKRPLSGQYLGKENMMRKFDDTLRDTDGDGYAEYLPYDTGRTGPNAETRRAMLSEEEFDGIFDYVGELVGKLCEEIRDGYIAKSPFENGCRYCKFRSICGGSEGEREVPKADIETITEATNGGKVD
ncbi:MAG: PD-(D/E)XK nuclease family protein, partial [Christensenellales bacterium]